MASAGTRSSPSEHVVNGGKGFFLGGGHDHRGRHADTFANLGADPAGDRDRGAHAAARPGDVEEGLIDTDLLHHRRDLTEDGHHLTGDRGVQPVAHGQDDRLGAQPVRSSHRHGRGDAVDASLVGGGRHDSAPARSAHDEGPSGELGMLAQLDGGEESVHIDVEDRRARIVLAPGTARLPGARGPTHDRLPSCAWSAGAGSPTGPSAGCGHDNVHL